MKKINILNYLFVLIFSIILLIVSKSAIYNFTMFGILLFSLLICLIIFSLGCLNNKEKIYKINTYVYMFTYICLLICLTMFIHRGGFGLIDKEYFIYYIKTINIIPFKTIIGYIKNINNISAFMYNVIGNLIALMPLSIILILIDSKNNNIKRQFIFLICTTFIIEIFQLLFGTGSFDIDDFILNIGGSIIMLIIINKLNIVNKIRSLFYQDFNIKFKYKIIIHIIILIITFILNIIILYEYISAYSYQEEPSTDIIYISERENCDGVDNKNIGEYYISFECLDVIYQSKDNVQINLIDALEQGYISVDDLKQILLDNNFLYDEDNNCFSNTSDSNYVYMYDNKIIFTKESLNN